MNDKIKTDEGLGNSKGNLIRIAVQCGLENDDALHKFIAIVRRRIDAAAGRRPIDSEMMVQDLKTGEWYNPKEEFDKLMDTPEVKAQMERMKFG